MERTILHIVGGESRARAEQARIAFALGQHAEIYSSVEELLNHRPTTGIIFAAETGESEFGARLIRLLGTHGIWIPIVVTAAEIELERVVAAVKAGALDYLALPFEIGAFARRFQIIIEQAGPYQERQRVKVQATHRIARLSRREQQVLQLLSGGLQNKDIGKMLEISSRTVEIHRSNMMSKLRASHPADAVKAWLAAEPDLVYDGPTAGEDARPNLRDARPAMDPEEDVHLFRKFR